MTGDDARQSVIEETLASALIADPTPIEPEEPIVPESFVPLLVALAVTEVLASLADLWPALFALLTSVVLFAGMITVLRDPPVRLIVGGILMVCLPLRWAVHFCGDQYPILILASHVSLGLYFVALEALVLTRVIAHRQITTQTVVGAICGYLLIAYVFGFAFAILEFWEPRSIIIGGLPAADNRAADIEQDVGELMYFSFVTLTTVGYGDFVPASRIARTLVVMEVLAGQLYLAAFVARLVGAMTTSRGPDRQESQ